MRRLITIALLFCLCSAATRPTRQASAARAGATSGEALRLMTSAVEKRYCVGGGMLLVLRLTYKNTGDERQIVFKYSLPPSEYMFSQSVERAGAKDYERVVSPMVGHLDGNIKFEDSPSPEYFVTLEPGELYSPPNFINVPVIIREASGDDPEEGLKPGRHFIQLRVSTWPSRSVSPVEVGRRWSGFGNLWSQDMLSQPMEFQADVPARRVLSNCHDTQADVSGAEEHPQKVDDADQQL